MKLCKDANYINDNYVDVKIMNMFYRSKNIITNCVWCWFSCGNGFFRFLNGNATYVCTERCVQTSAAEQLAGKCKVITSYS